jgi:tetratricopeptide (TPR) repeat protein
MLLTLFAPLLLTQAIGGGPGPLVTPGRGPAVAENPLREAGAKRRRSSAEQSTDLPTNSRLKQCLQQADSDAETAETTALAWLKEAKGSATAEPQLCLGVAQGAQGEWEAAEASFIAGRDNAAASDHLMIARLGAMAGNAALANDAPDRSLIALESAGEQAYKAEQPHLAGDIALDRARALVMLKRDDEAAAALTEARAANPNNPEGWLLSATLSRRMKRLDKAQTQIQTAAELSPIDPQIGLEAGVIALLSGRDESARKSWLSVIAAAPSSDSAEKARTYLAQITPVATPIAAPVATTSHSSADKGNHPVGAQ